MNVLQEDRNSEMSDATQPISKCYRPGREWLVIGIVGAIFFPTFGISSVYAAYWNIDGSFPHPRAHAFVHAVFWSFWTLNAFWIIAVYFRTRLTITPLGFSRQGCLIRTQINIADVSQVIWKGIPQSGKLILHGPHGQMKIDLNNLAHKDLTEFIQLVHKLFDQRIQTGWSEFNRYSFAAAPSSKDKRRAAKSCALILFVFGVVCLLCGWFNLGVQFYVAGICGVLTTVWYIWRIQRHKHATPG